MNKRQRKQLEHIAQMRAPKPKASFVQYGKYDGVVFDETSEFTIEMFPLAQAKFFGGIFTLAVMDECNIADAPEVSWGVITAGIPLHE